MWFVKQEVFVTEECALRLGSWGKCYRPVLLIGDSIGSACKVNNIGWGEKTELMVYLIAKYSVICITDFDLVKTSADNLRVYTVNWNMTRHACIATSTEARISIC